MNRKIFFVLLAALLIIAVPLFFWWRDGWESELVTKDLSFKFSKEYSFTKLGDEEKGGQLARMHATKPDRLIELSLELDAKKIADLTHKNFLDFLENNAKKAFPLRYKDFSQHTTERLTLDGREALIISFNYSGKNNEKIYAYFWIIGYNNDAYYLLIQSVNEAAIIKDNNKIRSTIKIN